MRVLLIDDERGVRAAALEQLASFGDLHAAQTLAAEALSDPEARLRSLAAGARDQAPFRNDDCLSTHDGRMQPHQPFGHAQIRIRSSLRMSSLYMSSLRRRVALARCRFRYRQVAKQDFGLDILDILGLDSKELNQVHTAQGWHTFVVGLPPKNEHTRHCLVLPGSLCAGAQSSPASVPCSNRAGCSA